MPLAFNVSKLFAEPAALHQRVQNLCIALAKFRLLETHVAPQAAEDLQIRQRLSQRLHDLDLGGQSQIEIRSDEIVELQETRRRQHVVGQRGRVGREKIERDRQQIVPLQRARANAPDCGQERQRIHVPHEQRTRALRISRTSVKSMWLEARSAQRPYAQHRRLRRLEPRSASCLPRASKYALGSSMPRWRKLPFKIQETRARLAKIAGQRGQERAGAHDVAAGRLALQALTQPQQRRAPRIQVRDLLDQSGRERR